MSSNLIKAILFDFDGVLTTDATGSHSICNYISNEIGININIIKTAYYKYNNDLLYGRIKHQEMWEAFCGEIGKKLDISILYDSFINTPIDIEMMSMLHKLKEKGYIIGMITDNKLDRIQRIVDFHNWEQLFDTITISSEIGSGKDKENIFLKTLGNLGLNANECIFIDNQEKNLIIPIKLGMKVIYFNDKVRNGNQLVEELRFHKINL